MVRVSRFRVWLGVALWDGAARRARGVTRSRVLGAGFDAVSAGAEPSAELEREGQHPLAQRDARGQHVIHEVGRSRSTSEPRITETRRRGFLACGMVVVTSLSVVTRSSMRMDARAMLQEADLLPRRRISRR
jgi:hypothetical protein